MKKYILILLVLALLAQPKLAPVESVTVARNSVVIMGAVPCQSVVWAETKVKTNVARINVYYKASPNGIKGCALGGQRYSLRVWVGSAKVVFVNGVRVKK